MEKKWGKMKSDVCSAIDKLGAIWDEKEATLSEEEYREFVNNHFKTTAGLLAIFCGYVDIICMEKQPPHMLN